MTKHTIKVISVFVSSLDGKITKGELPPRQWASLEDKEFFKKIREENSLIVMGRGTFDPKFIKSQEGKLRIILTHRPEQYKQSEVPGKVEFVNKSPKQLILALEKEHYQQMLLVAGTQITTEFFKEKLVDELWITVEPKLFGEGKSILTEALDIALQLFEIKQLNKQGTLLLKYQVIKEKANL